MVVAIQNKPYRLYFQHLAVLQPIVEQKGRGKVVERKQPYSTVCTLIRDLPTGGEERIAIGQTNCRPDEPFSYWEGRKWALRYCLRRFPRDIRTEIWKQYLLSHPVPVTPQRQIKLLKQRVRELEQIGRHSGECPCCWAPDEDHTHVGAHCQFCERRG